MATGVTNKHLAARLFLSQDTVRNHVQNILHKLGAHSKVEAVTFALRHGIIRDLDAGAVAGPPHRSSGDGGALAGRPDGMGPYGGLAEVAHGLAHVGSSYLDMASGTFQWTDEHYRIFGRTRSRFSPTLSTYLACVHDADRARVWSAINATVAAATPHSLLARIRRPGGEIRWIESVGVPSVAGGEVVGVVGTVVDVTARELSRTALVESEARYTAVTEAAAEGIWAIDADGHTTFANRRAAAMFGRSTAEMMTESVFTFMDDNGRAIAAATFARPRALNEGRLEFRWVKADGTQLWTWLTAVPMHDSDRAFTGVLLMLTDTTESRPTVIDLRASRNVLETARTRLSARPDDVDEEEMEPTRTELRLVQVRERLAALHVVTRDNFNLPARYSALVKRDVTHDG
jgi:PAS domain S-box-containing protein